MNQTFINLMRELAMDMEFCTLLATMLMAGATLWLGFSTRRLANSTIDMACEARE